MALSSKDLVAQFKVLPTRTPEEVEEYVAAAQPLQSLDLLKLLEVITAKGASSDLGGYKLRCSVFGRFAEAAQDKRLFLPFVKALKGADPTLRAALLPAIPKVNNIAEHADVCAMLKSPEQPLRQVGAQVLKLVGGKTALQILGELIADPGFAGRIEAIDVLAQSAGHYAIPSLKVALGVGKPAEKLHALKYLGDPKYVAKDVPGAVKAIAPALADRDAEVALSAISAFCAVVPDEDTYFEFVGPFIDSDRVEQVRAAIEGMRRFRSPRIIATLERKITAGPNAVRMAVLTTLEAIGSDDVLPPLVAALGHKQVVVRTRAGEVLTSLSVNRKVDVARTVVWLLRSRDVNVRRMAVEVARSVKDQSSDLWPKLLAYLRDEDWWVRERVMDALVEMAGSQLTRHLVPYFADKSDVVRRFAIDAVARLKDPQALGALVRLAAGDPDWWTREKALEAIAVIKDPRAIPYVLDLLNREKDLRVSCLAALEQLGAQQAIPQVVPLLASDDPDVRLGALKCLSTFGDPSQAPAVQPLRLDPDFAVRSFARELLNRWKIAFAVEVSAAERAGATLDRLLLGCAQAEGDDLILQGNRQPMIKRMGKTQPLVRNVLTEEQIRGLIMPQLNPGQVKELEALREVDFSYEVKSEGLRFRANIFLSMTGLSAVFRIIKGTLPEFDKLGLPPIVRTFGDLKNGLVLVGGPTGSGKSTTLAALIDYINATSSRHIISLEDPIEVIHQRKKSLVNQREIGVHAQSFSSALRATLREDPDVILVGEMRDLPTISFAVTAAETGHLVFGTIHTASADTSVDRLINAFPPGQQDQVRSMLAQSLRAVVCQYLLKRQDQPGRVLALEVLLNNDAVANLIRKGKAFQIPSIIATSREQGMQLMDTDLMRLYKEGKVSADDVFLKARNKKDFEDVLGVQGKLPEAPVAPPASASRGPFGGPTPPPVRPGGPGLPLQGARPPGATPPLGTPRPQQPAAAPTPGAQHVTRPLPPDGRGGTGR